MEDNFKGFINYAETKFREAADQWRVVPGKTYMYVDGQKVTNWREVGRRWKIGLSIFFILSLITVLYYTTK